MFRGIHLILALLIAAGFWVSQTFFPAEREAVPAEQVEAATGAEARDVQAARPETPPAPATLQRQITALGEGFDGDVGIVVQSLDDDWIAQHEGARILPQQSLSKLWVAATLLDQVDEGLVSLDRSVTLTRDELSIFHQPIREKILAQGSYTTTIGDLLRRAMTQSDNAANAALFGQVGGQAGVMRFLESRGLSDITMATSEIDLQMSIVGMEWDERYSYGLTFWEEREKLSFAVRAATMGQYLAAPPDGATPLAIAKGLAALQSGQLLSPASTALLVDLMAQSKTGPKRLRGGLRDGWTLPHKTGTGQVLQELATAYNDIGILTSPHGRRYAVVVMIGATNRPVPDRQELMQAVTRAVIDCDSGVMVGCGASPLSTSTGGDGTGAP